MRLLQTTSSGLRAAFALALATSIPTTMLEATSPAGDGVRLCSIGYPTDVAKYATTRGADASVTDFQLVDAKTGAVVVRCVINIRRGRRTGGG